MTQIKSEKAKERIEYYSDDTDFIYPLTKEQIVEVIVIAETEIQEHHAKELQSVHDMYKQIFIEHHREYESDKYHIECNHEIALQELKDKAVEAVNTALCYYGCSKGEYCQEPCERRDLIIQKLNEK